MMKASAQRIRPDGFVHAVELGSHRLTVDEPVERGGADEGPSPQELLAASLASCTAITIEMYAKRKGWDIPTVDVEVEYVAADHGGPARFALELRLPASCTQEQLERIQAIAAKCPIHRILEGDVIFSDRVKLVSHTAS